MAYARQNFVDQLLDVDGNVVREGTTLRAEHLNHIEEGIEQLFNERVCYDESTAYFDRAVDEPLEIVQVDDITSMYKMLEEPLTKAELVGSVIYAEVGGEPFESVISESEITEEGSVVAVGGDFVVSVFSDCTYNGVSLTNGLWVTHVEDAIHVLKLVDPNIKQVEEKYLPDSLKLPKVTTTDNGKHLEVSGGVWKAIKPKNTLPTVTTEDNGKLLQVVSGKWTAVSMQNVAEEGL